MSQLQLGDAVARPWRKPVHRNHISKIERGLANPSVALIVELVNELDGDMPRLIERAEELLATAETGSIDEPPGPRRGPLHFKREEAAAAASRTRSA
jgi:transcriptional regulator with XRE-family HTH domain